MERIKKLSWLLVLSPTLTLAAGNVFQINAVNLNGQIFWTNAFTSGVCTVEAATLCPPSVSIPNIAGCGDESL